MEIFLDCLPCMLRQVIEASRMVTDDQGLQDAIVKDALNILSGYNIYTCSPQMARDMHQLVKKYTKVNDPYENIKVRDIKAAKELYPLLKNFMMRKNQNIYWALKTAAVGNTMDSAIINDPDLKNCISAELEKEFALSDFDLFLSKLDGAKSLLILGDNSGETVFDLLLTESEALSGLDIIYSVRSEPIINDATYKEALVSGLNARCRIISTGCNAPGLILSDCDDRFLEIFNSADIIISKGQGNFEALSDTNKNTFFLLKAKCPVISRKLNVKINDYVFKYCD